MRNPLKTHSRLCTVPSDLKAVTRFGDEEPCAEVGVSQQAVEQLWQRATAVYSSGVHPALQLCVHVKGKRVLNRAIGYSHGNEGATLSPQATVIETDTPVNLFSAAKAVTAMLVHKLDEMGELRIDDRVSDYIPRFAKNGKQHITLRHVLTHRAGIHRIPSEYFDLDLLTDPEQLLQMLCDLSPTRAIGGTPAYHAISGGFVLGEVMRHATQEDPRKLLQKLIKEPLKLKWLDYGVDEKSLPLVPANVSTGFSPSPITAHLTRAIGVSLSDAAELANDPRFLKALVPAANVISSSQDMAAFYQCLLDEGRYGDTQVFDRRTVQRAILPDHDSAGIDRSLGLPMRYSAGFMLGHRGLSLYGLNRSDTFGHLGLSNTLTGALPFNRSAFSLISTGKPLLGPHIVSFIKLVSGLNSIGGAS